jgi:transposase
MSRLQALEVWRQTGSWQGVSERFGVSRATLYRGRKRLDPQDLRTLAARSRRPRRVRQPQTPVAVLQRLQALREQYPRWGLAKLRVLLQREGIALSAKTIDRGLARLKARGVLVEPPRIAPGTRTRSRSRPYAVRKPHGYTPRQPGDMVQVDTQEVHPLPGVILQHVMARDVISRWEVLAVYSRATARTAAHFLDTL